MLVSLTVGKVDAGVAVLLTEDKRLIEFPSILLPSGIQSGSIVDINVARNQQAESVADRKFSALQAEFFATFGVTSPAPPVLRCRNATQTSVVLEWDAVELATADFRSLSLYRNGTKAGNIPRDKLSTKISGLALDTEYSFHLVLRTSAGQYSSEKVVVRTHKMTDLHGITITPGIMPGQLKESLAETVGRMGAKVIDSVRIDTTHFVCTEPRGQAWEKAVEMNVPVVVPDWVKGCEREGRIVGVRGYYLDADPKLRQMGPSTNQQPGSVSSASPRIEHTPPTPERPTQSCAEEEHGADVVAVPAPGVPAPTPKASEDSARAPAAHGKDTSARQVDDVELSESEDDKEAADPEKRGVRDGDCEEGEEGEGEEKEEEQERQEQEEQEQEQEKQEQEKQEQEQEKDRPTASKASPPPGEDARFDEVEL